MSLSSSVPLCFLVCHHALLFAHSFRDMLVLPRVFAILSFQLEAQKCQLDTTPWQLCHNKIRFLSMGLSRDRPAWLDLQALSHRVAELGLTRVIFWLSGGLHYHCPHSSFSFSSPLSECLPLCQSCLSNQGV